LFLEKSISLKARVWNKSWRSKKQYFIHPFRLVFNWLFIKHVRFLLDDKSTVLEVGCGTASSLKMLKCKRVGIDFSRSAISLAKNNINLILAEACFLPFKNNVFNLSYAQGLIEHLSFEDRVKVINEMRRVSYAVVISVPKKGGLLHLAHRIFIKLRLKWIFADEKYFTEDELSSLLADFTSTKTQKFFHMTLIGYGLQSPLRRPNTKDSETQKRENQDT